MGGLFDLPCLAGLGEAELNGLPFRLKDDLQLVLSPERKVLPLCEYVHQAVTVSGAADFELSDHVLVQKQRPASWRVIAVSSLKIDLKTTKLIIKSRDESSSKAEGDAADAEPVLVPYRYSVSPAKSGKCNVFKPNALAEDQTLRTCQCQLHMMTHML